MSRLVTAGIGVPILYVIIRFMPPVVFLAVVIAAIALGCRELFELAARRGIRAHRVLGTALAIAVAYTFFDARIGTLESLVASMILIPIAAVGRGAGRGVEGNGATLSAAGVTMMAVLILGLLMGFPLALLGDGGERGRDLIVLLFLVVWLADAGAFLVGSLWGARRLVPAISPGKTVEGAAGALVTAVIAACAARLSFFTGLTLADAVLIGLLLGAAGILGDLFESMIKRAAETKDSGVIFPGHGGLLDRTDSLLFAAPVLFYYNRFFLA